MTISTRLAVAFCASLLAAAQPPVAPPPHLALDELVKEYKRLGLPLPPANAELVRIERGHLRIPDPGARLLGTGPRQDPTRHERYLNDIRELSEHPRLLAYHVPPPKPGGPTRYLAVGWFGVGLLDFEGPEPEWVAEARPDSDALRWVPAQSGSYSLTFAVQCKALGWDDLAVALYARARERFAADNSSRSALTELREVAWGFWALCLTDRDTDRKDIYRRLAALFEEEPALRTKYNAWLLRALNLTVSARKSKAGTIEALIDGLTDYWDNSHGGVLTEAGFVPHPVRAKTEWATYWELAERGFDAVPALIEHAADERLTRAWKAGFNNFSDNRITVGNLCSRLLNQISNRDVRVGLFDFPPDPAQAREWFEAAKKVGEEKWLVAHAMPPDKPIVNWEGCAEPLIVRVIGVKYPARLSEVYRAWLKRPYTECWGENFAEEVVLSKLPREQKVILLKEGAISGPHFRRIAALEGLARLDPEALRNYFRVELAQLCAEHILLDLAEVTLGFRPPRRFGIDEACLVRLTAQVDDPVYWAALTLLGQTADRLSRRNFIKAVGTNPPPNQPQHRAARLRFLLHFLADTSLVYLRDPSRSRICDVAADRLAIMLGLRAPRGYGVPNLPRGPLASLFIRAAVAKAATEELTRLKK